MPSCGETGVRPCLEETASAVLSYTLDSLCDIHECILLLWQMNVIKRKDNNLVYFTVWFMSSCLFLYISSEGRRHTAEAACYISKLWTSSAQTHEVKPFWLKTLHLTHIICHKTTCVSVLQTIQRCGDWGKPLLLLRLWETQCRNRCLPPWQVQMTAHSLQAAGAFLD